MWKGYFYVFTCCESGLEQSQEERISLNVSSVLAGF